MLPVLPSSQIELTPLYPRPRHIPSPSLPYDSHLGDLSSHHHPSASPNPLGPGRPATLSLGTRGRAGLGTSCYDEKADGPSHKP